MKWPKIIPGLTGQIEVEWYVRPHFYVPDVLNSESFRGTPAYSDSPIFVQRLLATLTYEVTDNLSD